MPAGPLLPYLQRAARLALNLHGLASHGFATELGQVHAYAGTGQGALPATVVLHGIGSAATQFGRLLLSLRPHVQRLLAPDLPGHGFSAPPRRPLTPELLFNTLHPLFEAWGHPPWVLIGNSLGGALALRYALEYPAHVHALVLISPAGAHMTPLEWQTLLESFRMHTNQDARRFLRRLYHRTPIYMPAFASGLRATMQSQAVADLLQAASPADLSPPERLRELSVPTLLLWGRSERLLPASSLDYFRRHLPTHAVIEEPAGFGHCPHIDDPARLARRVITFLSGVAGAALQ
jgi:pimeloyl-ACP methyl ester carboxylesterase